MTILAETKQQPKKALLPSTASMAGNANEAPLVTVKGIAGPSHSRARARRDMPTAQQPGTRED